MSDLSQNTTNVAVGTPSSTFTGFVGGTSLTINVQSITKIAGGTINAGMPVYQDANNAWQKALASGNSTQSGNTATAIALDSSQTGQPIVLFRQGYINLGATLTVGQTYVVSNNAGGIAPISDLATNSYVTILGVAINTSYLSTPPGGPFASGTQKA